MHSRTPSNIWEQLFGTRSWKESYFDFDTALKIVTQESPLTICAWIAYQTWIAIHRVAIEQ